MSFKSIIANSLPVLTQQEEVKGNDLESVPADNAHPESGHAQAWQRLCQIRMRFIKVFVVLKPDERYVVTQRSYYTKDRNELHKHCRFLLSNSRDYTELNSLVKVYEDHEENCPYGLVCNGHEHVLCRKHHNYVMPKVKHGRPFTNVEEVAEVH